MAALEKMPWHLESKLPRLRHGIVDLKRQPISASIRDAGTIHVLIDNTSMWDVWQKRPLKLLEGSNISTPNKSCPVEGWQPPATLWVHPNGTLRSVFAGPHYTKECLPDQTLDVGQPRPGNVINASNKQDVFPVCTACDRCSLAFFCTVSYIPRSPFPIAFYESMVRT